METNVDSILVATNRKLDARMEKKIQATLEKIWNYELRIKANADTGHRTQVTVRPGLASTRV